MTIRGTRALTFLVFAFAVILQSGCSFFPRHQAAPNPVARAYHQTAGRYFSARRFDEGIEALRQAIAIAPEDSLLYADLHWVCNFKKQQDIELAIMQDVLRAEPDNELAIEL